MPVFGTCVRHRRRTQGLGVHGMDEASRRGSKQGRRSRPDRSRGRSDTRIADPAGCGGDSDQRRSRRTSGLVPTPHQLLGARIRASGTLWLARISPRAARERQTRTRGSPRVASIPERRRAARTNARRTEGRAPVEEANYAEGHQPQEKVNLTSQAPPDARAERRPDRAAHRGGAISTPCDALRAKQHSQAVCIRLASVHVDAD